MQVYGERNACANRAYCITIFTDQIWRLNRPQYTPAPFNSARVSPRVSLSASVVAMHFFFALVTFLRFKRQGCNRARIQTL